MYYTLNHCWIAQLTVLRIQNADSAGSIPSLASTFNSFDVLEIPQGFS